MSTTATHTDGLEAVLARFTGISGELLESYERLAIKASRVEAELAGANRRLEDQVAQLDRVSGHLEAVLEALPTGVLVRSSSGDLERSNAAALKLGALVSPEHPRRGCLELIARDAAEHGLVSVQGFDGGTRHIRRRRESIHTTHAGCVGEVWILEDVSEQLRLEAQVRVAEKMSALGTLSAGVAHEIRNPLNAVSGFASLLVADLPEGSRARRWAECIAEGARRTDEVVTSLVSFARPGDLHLETVQLLALIADARDQELQTRPEAERWQVSIDGPAIVLCVDRIKLRQAVRNLLANAMDCQPEGGAVRIHLRAEAQAWCVDVEDGGPGLPEHGADRLLEPFFTTRAAGTGLGLALADTIARLHGGSLHLDSDRSELGGARLILRLPRTATVASPQ
jgi:signal transduction histidine kinase